MLAVAAAAALMAVVAAGAGASNAGAPPGKWQHETPIVWGEIRLELELLLAENRPLAPRFLRLAWHSSATFSPFEEPQGGSNGATMRFEPENSYGQNRGMQDAIDALDPIHQRHASEVSVSDLWIFAAYVSVEHLEGPVVGFTPGRTDATSGGENCPPEDRLPISDESPEGIREIFGHRLGLTDREFVAIMGAHSVGRAHPEFSGFPSRHWDTTPQVLDNLYYGLLREPPAGVEWQEDVAVNPETGEEMRFFRSYSWLMLPVDMLLREDPLFRPIMEEYARFENLDAWRQDFAAALRKVTELGLEYNSGPEGGVRARIGTAVPCPGRAGAAGLLRGGDGGCPFMRAPDSPHKHHRAKPVGHP
jgi:cytochrome c peroxidase